MLTRRYRTWTGLAFLAVAVGLAAATACDLNPQPLPPGEAAFASEDAGPVVAVPVAGGESDGGANLLADGGPPEGIPVPPDGGDAGAPDASDADAGDGGDATAEDGGDAGIVDGSTDAHEDAE